MPDDSRGKMPRSGLADHHDEWTYYRDLPELDGRLHIRWSYTRGDLPDLGPALNQKGINERIRKAAQALGAKPAAPAAGETALVIDPLARYPVPPPGRGTFPYGLPAKKKEKTR